ncbi:MAG: hypothetical protein GDA39_10025, partial [Hyphomonadaceae bacterium]|nr:hypothetical protein [Hyphomonadaceae bacterium]
MHLIRAATLSVADLDAAVRRYAWLNYSVVEQGNITPDLAHRWNAPNSAQRRYAVMRPESGADIFLRFIEQDLHPDYKALRTHGWAAIEICTQDTLRVNAVMKDSPFEIIGPPRKLDGMPAIFPMQVRGADGEIVYLTQITGDMPEYDLPRAQSLMDTLFILVLAAPDLEAEARWIRDRLRVSKGRTVALNYTMINGAFGLPDGTQHELATIKHDRDVFLEVDQYPAAATPRARNEGQLPPGICIGSFIHPEFDRICDINAGS